MKLLFALFFVKKKKQHIHYFLSRTPFSHASPSHTPTTTTAADKQTNTPSQQGGRWAKP